MIAKLHPHPDQVLWYLQSALGGFETLSLDDAVSNARADARALLAYLDRTDNAVLVTGIEAIKSGVWDELSVSESEVANFGKVKDARLSAAKQRFDAMLKGAMKSPPKPLKAIPTTKQKREAAKSKLVKKPGS